MFYVIATDRAGSEMRPGGIVLHKQVFICGDSAQAERIRCELQKRRERYGAIQTTSSAPVFNPRVYTWDARPAAAFLQGR